MIEPALWWLLLGPLGLLLLGLVPDRLANRRPMMMASGARWAALFALAMSLLGAVVVLWRGAARTATLGASGLGLGLYLDALSATMFVLVAFVGAIVVNYSRNYLEGDPRHGCFTSRLCFTLAMVLLVIISGNLVQFALAWVATSIGLNRLLLFYRERPAAIMAARKKFLASRLGDLCLLVAMILAYRLFHSLDYHALFDGGARLKASGARPLSVTVMGLLFVATAMLKSAQFPLHGWLIEVMETPTPVSALLHAGIINAGGFLVLRLSNLLVLSGPALEALAIIGAVTALFGSVVMLPQTSIKVSLAYSTIAQMGFMMLECGLGAFSAALLHILAHSLYKAHAFLSSGSVIDIARASWTPSPGGQPHPWRLAIAIAAVLAVGIGVGAFFGVTLLKEPGVYTLGAVVMLGLIHLISNGIDERPNAFVVLRTLVYALAVGVSYFALQWATRVLLGDSVASTAPLRGPLDTTIIIGVILAFAALTVFQSRLARKSSAPQWQGLYAHVANGFYVNTLANRGVVRFWPAPPPRTAPPSYAAREGEGAAG
jgi:NAD(P)H-quinone oxidoreductase subunit 5